MISKYRTNISLGKEDLFYKGASPFQYNLESRNTSFKEVNENSYLYAKLYWSGRVIIDLFLNQVFFPLEHFPSYIHQAHL